MAQPLSAFGSHCYVGPCRPLVADPAVQFTVAVGAFLNPKASLGLHLQVAPYHTFLGRLVFVLGLANMCVSALLC